MTFVWIGRHRHFRHCRGGDSGAGLHLVRGGAVAALLSLELGAVLWLQIVVFLGGLHRGAGRNAPAGAQNAG